MALEFETPSRKRHREESILTPTRSKLRQAFKETEGDVLDQKIKEANFVNLEEKILTYHLENKLFRSLVICRKVKEYHETIGPFDGARVVVATNGSYKMYVHEKIVDSGDVLDQPKQDSLLGKLNDCNYISCPGVSEYSSFKSSIGYDVKGMCFSSLLPEHVRHSDCLIFYRKSPKKLSPICEHCLKLRKRLTSLKKNHDSLPMEEKVKRTSSSSNFPNQFLSPASRAKKEANTSAKVKCLRQRNERLTAKSERYEFEETQAQELACLVKAINEQEDGRAALESMYHDAEEFGGKAGKGELLRTIWKNDVEGFDEFTKDQEINSMCLVLC